MTAEASVSYPEGTAGVPLAAGRPGGARVLGSLGWVEALRLARHPAVLAGLAGTVALFVVKTTGSAPRWWVDDVVIGTALLFVGVALGRWAPQAWAGLFAGAVVGLVELDLVVPSFDAPLRLSRAIDWLLPWHEPVVLAWLPGPIPGLPPAGAHLVELVGLGVLVGLGALLASKMRGRSLVAAATAACLVSAAVGWSCWSETRPISLGELDGLVAMATQPAAHER